MNFFRASLIAVLLTGNLTLFAQSGSTTGGEIATGLRLGGSSGITAKKYAKSNQSAVELIASYSFDPNVNNLGVTALFEKLAPLSGKRLNAQIGFGPTWIFRDTRIGISGMLGFDWRLKRLPVTMSVDWAPTFFFINRTGFSPVNGGFSARYVLNAPKKTARQSRVPGGGSAATLSNRLPHATYLPAP